MRRKTEEEILSQIQNNEKILQNPEIPWHIQVFTIIFNSN